jgi:hypothetical protein
MFDTYGLKAYGGKWRSPMFMPRWASRITLEVTAVRPERLGDISDADAIAEGVRVLPLQSADDPSAWWQVAPGVHQARTPRESYFKWYRAIHGQEALERNDWVWVVDFRGPDG